MRILKKGCNKMRALDTALWFLDKNPSLRSNYIDENIKLNKLLYFSSLMYYAVEGKDLLDEKFQRWDRGPVIPEVYREYRYCNLSSRAAGGINNISDKAKQTFEIINFVYAGKSARELSDITHEHRQWLALERNEELDFSKSGTEELSLMRELYNLYAAVDFDNLCTEKINDVVYIYDKTNLEITDEIAEQLADMNNTQDAVFLEDIDGELVFS